MSTSSRKRSKDTMSPSVPISIASPSSSIFHPSSSSSSSSAFAPLSSSPPAKRLKSTLSGIGATGSEALIPPAGQSNVSALGPAITNDLDVPPPAQAGPTSPSNNGDMSNGSSQQPEDKEEIMASDGFTIVKKDKGKEKKKRNLEKARLAELPQFLYNTDGFKQGKKIGIAHVRDLILYIVAENTAPSWMMIKNKSSITHTVVLMCPGILPTDLGIPPVHVTAHMPFEITPRKTSASSTSPSAPSAQVPPTSLPIMHKLFSHACPTRAPGDFKKLHSALQGLLMCPLSDKERARKEKERNANWRKFEDAKIAAAGAEGGSAAGGDSSNVVSPDPSTYLLTPNEMQENKYPLPEWMFLEPGDEAYDPRSAASGSGTTETREDVEDKDEGPSDRQKDYHKRAMANGSRIGTGAGWVETPKAVGAASDGSKKLKVVAIDCEMCNTCAGSELTRITAIDYDTGKVLLDEFVRPANPILDYLTQFSGITEEKLATATHDLAAIHARLYADGIITPYTILLGHSLDSDLTAMKIRHPLCIDTSLLYTNARGGMYKTSLKVLTSKFLGRNIQTGGMAGHDSEEDARACIDLLKMKLLKGPDFGDVVADSESIFDRMSRHTSGANQPGKSTAICDYGKTLSWHGQKAKTSISCKSDDEVTQAIIDNVGTHDFTFARWMQLDNARQWSGYIPPASNVEGEDPKARRAAAVAADLPPSDERAIPQALGQLNERLTKLYDALPLNTALILLTGNSDPRRAVELGAKKQSFERAYKTLGPEGVAQYKAADRWETKDDRDLAQAVEEARFGMGFFCIR